MSVAAIILAAGASRRLGQPKQLVEYRGETLIARAARLAREAGLEPVVVVLGAEGEVVRAAVSTTVAVFVDNHHWQEGMASSIRAGVQSLDALAAEWNGALIMPCDQPKLTTEHLENILATFLAQGEPTIVASVYAGSRGVPAVFPRIVIPELMRLHGNAGARKLLVDPPCPVVEIPFPGGEIDIDVPEDLVELE